MSEKATMYTDGGSRGNPGPAAIGGVMEIGSRKIDFSEYIGKATNNEAEYQALIFGLKKLKQFLGKTKAKNSSVSCFLDSELVVKQLNHQYKLKDLRIQKFFIEIWNLSLDFGEVSFTHVRRGMNRKADALVNEALDKESSKIF
jgi:ribonuclease HI